MYRDNTRVSKQVGKQALACTWRMKTKLAANLMAILSLRLDTAYFAKTENNKNNRRWLKKKKKKKLLKTPNT